MTRIDSAILDLTEWSCRRFQVLTGRTNIWLALQLTNLSITVYFIWAAAYSWISGGAVRIFIGLFCAGLMYALTQTIFREPIEAYEQSAHRRVANGLGNPRRLRDAPLRISFLTLSLLLWYPVLLVYFNLHMLIVLVSYALVALTTVVLYLLACDPLPPCTGKVREWFRVPSRLPAPEPSSGDREGSTLSPAPTPSPADRRSRTIFPSRRISQADGPAPYCSAHRTSR
jgi:hypothetical protein